MEITSIALSILSFLVSTAVIVWEFHRKRESYTVELLDYDMGNPHELKPYLFVSNASAIPLVISKIAVHGVICELEHTAIRGTPGEAAYKHTPDFPVAIQAHSCAYLYLVFRSSKIAYLLTPGKPGSFEIFSTRRKKTVAITPGTHGTYLRK